MTITQSNSPEKEANRLTSIWQKFGPNLYPLDIDGLIDGAITKSDFRGEIEVKRGIFDSFEGCLVRTNGLEKWTILLNEATENKRR